MSPARTPSPSSRIALVLAVPALMVGLCVAYLMLHTAVLVTRMSAWPTVPATLDAVELHHPGSATSSSRSVGARYHYVIAGHTYAATRVSVYSPDSLGSFFQHTYDDLHTRLERGETVPAHVNPASPADAVLLPVWRPEVFAFEGALMLAFGGAGLFVLAERRRARKAGTATASGVVRRQSGATTGTPSDVDDRDDGAVDRGDRLPPRAAWGRRLILIGLLMLGADYLLLERSRGDQFALVDRLLASRVTATGTIFVSPPDDRVPPLFEARCRAMGLDARLRIEKSEPQAMNYDVTLTAPDRSAALAAMEQLLVAVRDSYRAQSGHDLSTFSNAYVAPVVTSTLRAVKAGILGGLLLLGLACVGVGVRRSVVPSTSARRQ
jgi:Protein of unknown function (DUF3592)